MTYLWTNGKHYRRAEYESEADLETAIVRVQEQLFGKDRIYLDVKRKIGVRGVQQNIPDGYLLDLTNASPRLYVVENELASHDPLRHIAVQLLQFSISFESEPRIVRRVLLESLDGRPAIKHRCERYARDHGLRGLDHLLDVLVHDVPFAALVVIDEVAETLESALDRKFKFTVEVLALERYRSSDGECIYHFSPFLEELSADLHAEHEDRAPATLDEIDTVVVPARREGFESVFLGENAWRAVRIRSAVREQLKFIAAYRVAPESAITHFAPIRSIEPYKDTNKQIVHFAEPAKPIGPIALVQGGQVKAPQSLRYTRMEWLARAKTLDDIW